MRRNTLVRTFPFGLVTWHSHRELRLKTCGLMMVEWLVAFLPAYVSTYACEPLGGGKWGLHCWAPQTRRRCGGSGNDEWMNEMKLKHCSTNPSTWWCFRAQVSVSDTHGQGSIWDIQMGALHFPPGSAIHKYNIMQLGKALAAGNIK